MRRKEKRLSKLAYQVKGFGKRGKKHLRDYLSMLGLKVEKTPWRGLTK